MLGLKLTSKECSSAWSDWRKFELLRFISNTKDAVFYEAFASFEIGHVDTQYLAPLTRQQRYPLVTCMTTFLQ